MQETLISTKYQVVIPKNVRKSMSLKPGQKLYVYMADNQIVLTQKNNWPEDHLAALKGLWKNIHATNFLKSERDSWE